MAWLQVPRPKTFLGLTTLQTGTELVSFALLLNKAIGIYGLLAMATGYALSPLQQTMYLWSLAVAATLAWCIPRVRHSFDNEAFTTAVTTITQTERPAIQYPPLEILCLAWVHVVDTLVNASYTAVFATMWYNASFHDLEGTAGKKGGDGEGDDNNSSSRKTLWGGSGGGGSSPLDEEQLALVTAGAGAQETVASLMLIVGLALLRVYFSLVVMACARQALRACVESGWATAGKDNNGNGEGEDEEGESSKDEGCGGSNPFAQVAGWRGRLGRALVAVGRGYWLCGQQGDEEWTKDVASKLRSRL